MSESGCQRNAVKSNDALTLTRLGAQRSEAFDQAQRKAEADTVKADSEERNNFETEWLGDLLRNPPASMIGIPRIR